MRPLGILYQPKWVSVGVLKNESSVMSLSNLIEYQRD